MPGNSYGNRYLKIPLVAAVTAREDVVAQPRIVAFRHSCNQAVPGRFEQGGLRDSWCLPLSKYCAD